MSSLSVQWLGIVNYHLQGTDARVSSPDVTWTWVELFGLIWLRYKLP